MADIKLQIKKKKNEKISKYIFFNVFEESIFEVARSEFLHKKNMANSKWPPN